MRVGNGPRTCAKYSTLRFVRSFWQLHQLDKKGWIFTHIVGVLSIGTCRATQSTWNSAKAESTATRAWLFGNFLQRSIAMRLVAKPATRLRIFGICCLESQT